MYFYSIVQKISGPLSFLDTGSTPAAWVCVYLTIHTIKPVFKGTLWLGDGRPLIRGHFLRTVSLYLPRVEGRTLKRCPSCWQGLKFSVLDTDFCVGEITDQLCITGESNISVSTVFNPWVGTLSLRYINVSLDMDFPVSTDFNPWVGTLSLRYINVSLEMDFPVSTDFNPWVGTLSLTY